MILKKFKLENHKNYKKSVGELNEKEAAYFLDFDFGNSDNYVIIHNLHLKYKNRVAQIDHLILFRFGIFILESKFFSGTIDIRKDENWIINYKSGDISIPSPVEQNQRHLAVLEDILKNEDIYPTFMGIKKIPEIHNVVLVSNKTILNGEVPKNVIKQDKLSIYMDDVVMTYNPIKNINRLSKIINQESLLEVGNKLLAFDSFSNSQNNAEDLIKENIKEKDSKPLDSLEKRLKAVRTKFAKEENNKPYFVFSNKELEEIIKIKPKNEEEFLKIKGVGKVKLEKYGKAFLEEISK